MRLVELHDTPCIFIFLCNPPIFGFTLFIVRKTIVNILDKMQFLTSCSICLRKIRIYSVPEHSCRLWGSWKRKPIKFVSKLEVANSIKDYAHLSQLDLAYPVFQSPGNIFSSVLCKTRNMPLLEKVELYLFLFFTA